MILLILAVLATAPARAAEAPVVRSTEPVATASVSVLKDRFVENEDTASRSAVLKQLAQTAPVSGQDVANLFDLFSRFSDKYTREAVMASLARIEPGSPQLVPMFMNYLRQPEPEAQLFGVNGAFRLRAREALPLIRDIASRKLKPTAVADANMLSERNAWWTQYEALSVLAQWEGDKAYQLVDAKGRESAKVGALLGRYYWKKTLPKLRAWADSADLLLSEKASLAVAAPIDPAEARATRAEMLALLRDPKVDAEIRHHLALKFGAWSNDEEAEALVREHDAAANGGERLYWAAAAFISRSPKIVPLLVRYARQTGDDTMSKGATAQLVDMVGEAEAQALIDAEKKK